MSSRKHPFVSVHQTLQSPLYVDWEKEYYYEYHCPYCNSLFDKGIKASKKNKCKIEFQCLHCGKTLSLTNKVPAYVYNYRSNVECPNPLCIKKGHDSQKGWIYLHAPTKKEYRCRFCRIIFKKESTQQGSWKGQQLKNNLFPFKFEEDSWDLRHFCKNPKGEKLYFHNIVPGWYRVEAKKYTYYLLRVMALSESTVARQLTTFKQLGLVLIEEESKNFSDINRNTINRFLDRIRHNSNAVINGKLSDLRDFFEWLGLETAFLIRSWDYLKNNKDDPDWLDEVTRQSIKNNLHKIPGVIARQYLIQEYTAARPGDVLKLQFDCLIEENDRWYIKFFQQKNQRWHKLLANREIRRTIEEQQQWIRKTLGEDYQYLFCHLRGILVKSYPNFSAMRALPKPPRPIIFDSPLVRIIRLLIEHENIVDANGRKPHFTGKMTRASKLQEVRAKYGMEAAQLYADHKTSKTTFQHYAPPTREQIAEVDLPFQELLLNPENKFLPWQSLPESLLKNPKAHELDLEIAPRIVVYGHCTLNPKTPCPFSLFPKCYGCSNFRPSTGKLPLYERQYRGEEQRLAEAEQTGAELASEEAKATINAMNQWLPELRRIADGQA